MNKEEIEEIKRLLFQDRLTQCGKRKLIKYIEYLEFKLDTITKYVNKEITHDDIQIDGSKFYKLLYKDSIIYIEEKALQLTNSYRETILNFLKEKNNDKR